MIIVDVEQGTPPWFKIKAGKISASNANMIITSQGKPSTQAAKCAYKLSGETILGMPEETFTSWHMERGVELEGEARDLYSIINGVEVQQVGVVFKDEERWCLCSPDGLISLEDHYEGGLEIKCPSLAVHMKYKHGNKCPADYLPQVQMSLFVTGLKYWDFMSYYPGLEPLLVRCYPDKNFHKALETELVKLKKKVNKIIKETS